MNHVHGVHVEYETHTAPIRQVEVRMCGDQRNTSVIVEKNGSIRMGCGGTFQYPMAQTIAARMDREQMRAFGEAIIRMAASR